MYSLNEISLTHVDDAYTDVSVKCSGLYGLLAYNKVAWLPKGTALFVGFV